MLTIYRSSRCEIRSFRAIIPEVRADKQRPKRKRALINSLDGLSYKIGLDPSSERCGVAFYWPWRKTARNKKMGWYDRDIERVTHAALDTVEVLPNIIVGCRWIREAIVTMICQDVKGTHAWSRDFNIHEYLEETIQKDVNITEFHSTKG